MRVFVESLYRLHCNHALDKGKVIELFNDGKITKEEMDYILDAH